MVTWCEGHHRSPRPDHLMWECFPCSPIHSNRIKKVHSKITLKFRLCFNTTVTDNFCHTLRVVNKLLLHCYMKFEEWEMRIIGRYWKHYRACLQALKKGIIGKKKELFIWAYRQLYVCMYVCMYMYVCPSRFWNTIKAQRMRDGNSICTANMHA